MQRFIFGSSVLVMAVYGLQILCDLVECHPLEIPLSCHINRLNFEQLMHFVSVSYLVSGKCAALSRHRRHQLLHESPKIKRTYISTHDDHK